MENALSSDTAPVSENKSPKSGIRVGIKFLFVDMGLSVAIGFVVGLIFGAAGAEKEQLVNSPWLIVIGLVVSTYSVFLLHRKYSQELRALLGLIIAAVIFSLMNMYHLTVSNGADVTKLILIMTAQILVYVIGWLLAKNTGVKLYMLSKNWVTAFMIIGMIVGFFTILGFVSVIAA